MSAGVCGKRVGFEEIFGPTSPTSFPSAKRPRSSSFGSGSDDSVSVLLQMFPDLDPQVRFKFFNDLIDTNLFHITMSFLFL